MLFVINLPALQWLWEEATSSPDLLTSTDFLCPVHETVSPFKTLNMVENMLGNDTFAKVSQGLLVWQKAKPCCGFVCLS